jgi:hypothetical protein
MQRAANADQIRSCWRSARASLVLADQIDRPRESVVARGRLEREGIAKAAVEGKYKGRTPTARAKAAGVLPLAKAGPDARHDRSGPWDRRRLRVPHPGGGTGDRRDRSVGFTFGCIVVGRLVPITIRRLLGSILLQIRMHKAALIHCAAMVSSSSGPAAPLIVRLASRPCYCSPATITTSSALSSSAGLTAPVRVSSSSCCSCSRERCRRSNTTPGAFSSEGS